MIEKFTQLTDEEVINILHHANLSYDLKRLEEIAKKTHAAREKYPDLKSYHPTADITDEQFIKVMNFIRDCGLAGVVAIDKDNPFDHIPGAEMEALLNSYMANKNRRKSHEIRVVRNCNFNERGLEGTPTLFRDNRGIHHGLRQSLISDFVDNHDIEARTYLIETFGTTGLNHFVSLTVRRDGKNGKPVADLFCSSPTLIRGGLESHQNSLACGIPAQFSVNATLTDVLGVDGFDYYHNLEPFQPGGGEICATYALEAAQIAASMDREKHLEILDRHYSYPGPYGGMVDIDLKKINLSTGKFKDGVTAEFNMPAEYLHLSGFTSNRESYRSRLNEVTHSRRKTQSTESSQDRVNRYTTQEPDKEDHTKTRLVSNIMEQKAIRQRLHIFEIINHEAFLALAPEIDLTATQVIMEEMQHDPARQRKDMIKRDLLPKRSLVRISDTSYDETSQRHTSHIYLGAKSAEKLIDQVQQPDMAAIFDVTSDIERFSDFTQISGQQTINNLCSSLVAEDAEAMRNLLQRTKLSLTYQAQPQACTQPQTYNCVNMNILSKTPPK